VLGAEGVTKMPKRKTGLPSNEERFCQEYVIDHNGTQAARRAGYRGSDATLATKAWRLLRKDEVWKRVRELEDAISTRNHLSAARTLEKSAEIVEADIAEITEEDGTIRSLRSIPPKFRKLIESLEYDIYGRPKIKLPSRNAALTNLMKHHKLITERSDINIHLSLEDLITKSYNSKDTKDEK
jgi:phage terminase small subunit